MIIVNGKEFKFNTDLKWGTQKLLNKMQDDPNNKQNGKYLEKILKDLLIPAPTSREMFEFRISDIERIVKSYSEIINETDKEFKKKRSQ